MATTNLTVKKGQCINFGNCPKADSKEVIEVKLGDDFICPECGGTLVELPPQKNHLKLILIIAGAVLALGGGGFAVYYNLIQEKVEIISEVIDAVEAPADKEPIEVEPQQELVTGVTLSPTSQTLSVGKTLQLTATVLPDNADNKAVSWESDNTAVATVDDDGKVKAIAEGTAKITVKTQDGYNTATCNIKVTNCMVTIPCGKYEGQSRNCQPHGMGTIRYTCHVQICPSDPEKRCAEAGQYLVGQFRDGKLLQGKLYDRNGTQLFVIICGGGAH
jgi:hypothetical protein